MVVHEEAYFETTIRGVSQVKSFLKESAPALLSNELLSPELMGALEDLVRRQQLLGVLRTVMQRGTLEPQNWRTKMRLPSEWVRHERDRRHAVPMLPTSRPPRTSHPTPHLTMHPTPTPADPWSPAATQDELLDKCAQVQAVHDRKTVGKRAIDDLNAHATAIYTSQERLRANIKSLEKMPGSDLMARYMRDLDREEDDLIQTRAKIEEHNSTNNGLVDEIEERWSELVRIATSLKEKI